MVNLQKPTLPLTFLRRALNSLPNRSVWRVSRRFVLSFARNGFLWFLLISFSLDSFLHFPLVFPFRLSSLLLSSYPLSSYPLSSYPLSSYPLSSYPLSSYPLSSFPLVFSSRLFLSSFPLVSARARCRGRPRRTSADFGAARSSWPSPGGTSPTPAPAKGKRKEGRRRKTKGRGDKERKRRKHKDE